MRVHRDILAGVLGCVAKRGTRALTSVGVNHAGTRLYGADGSILAVGDCSGFEEVAGATISGVDLAEVLMATPRERHWLEFEMNWDNIDGTPRLEAWVPTPSGDEKRAVRIHHDIVFPNPANLIEGHPFTRSWGGFAVASPEFMRVSRLMKPLGTVFIMPGQNRANAWWAVGRAKTLSKPHPELRLLVMPLHVSDWPNEQE